METGLPMPVQFVKGEQEKRLSWSHPNRRTPLQSGYLALNLDIGYHVESFSG